MKRVVLALVLLGALLMGSPSSIQAQIISFDVDNTVAVTNCVPAHNGKWRAVSVLNMAYLDSSIAKEIIVHEREHVRQFTADPSLCQELNDLKASGDPDKLAHWIPRLLQMEVGAYCVSADVALSDGIAPEMVYLDYLNRMTFQFSVYGLGRDFIARAWGNACGAKLGVR